MTSYVKCKKKIEQKLNIGKLHNLINLRWRSRERVDVPSVLGPVVMLHHQLIKLHLKLHPISDSNQDTPPFPNLKPSELEAALRLLTQALNLLRSSSRPFNLQHFRSSIASEEEQKERKKAKKKRGKGIRSGFLKATPPALLWLPPKSNRCLIWSSHLSCCISNTPLRPPSFSFPTILLYQLQSGSVW